MKLLKNFSALFLLLLATSGFSQGILGTWTTLDEETNEPNSKVLLKEVNGVLEGNIVEVSEGADRVCTACEGERKNQPIVGLNIIWGFKKKSDTEYTDGRILDPRNGKIYNCNISLNDDGSLDLRGYWKFTWLGKTRTWYKM